MNNTQDDRAERLRQARASAGYSSPTDAARAMGLQVPTYLGHENGSRGFQASAERYSDFFKVNLEWLLRGRGSMKGTNLAVPEIVQNTVIKRTQEPPEAINIGQWSRDVPILGGAVCGVDDLFELNGQTNGFVRRPPQLVGAKGVYALYVQGESMSPWREPGQLVYVHPAQPVKIGDYVVVQMVPEQGHASSKAYIKRLLRRSADKLILHQFRPDEDLTLSMRKVALIHRVVDWSELVGF